MAEYKVSVGLELAKDAKSNIKTQIQEIKGLKAKVGLELESDSKSVFQRQMDALTKSTYRAKVDLDISRVQKQINAIKRQIQNLSGIKINLYGAGTGSGGSGGGSDYLTKQFRELLSVSKQISSLELKIGGLKNVSGHTNQIVELEKTLNTLRNTYTHLVNQMQQPLTQDQGTAIYNNINRMQEGLDELDAKYLDTRQKMSQSIKLKFDNGDLKNSISSLENNFISLNTTSQTVSNNFVELKRLLSSIGSNNDVEAVIADYEKFKTLLQSTKNEVFELQRASTNNKNKTSLENSKTALNSTIDVWLKNNSAAAKKFGAELKNIQSQINTADKTKLASLKAQFQEITRQADLAGKTTQTFGDRLKSQLGRLSTYFSATMLIFQSVSVIRNMTNEIISLDTALIDLQKTSNATATRLNEFYHEANNIAKTLGTTTQNVIQAAADWSRLGLAMEDAVQMAKVSSIFEAISPDLDINQATDGLISAMKAFDIEAENALDGIASKINIIGNTQGVNNGDIVDILTRSSSAMAEANNTLEETIALGTAATEITRDAASVGTALKTISMRIRGYDEQTEEYVGGIEELSGDIADLTKTANNPVGISLFKDDAKTEFKSTTELLRDIREIYDDLTDKQQAGLLEALAGKRQGQTICLYVQ